MSSLLCSDVILNMVQSIENGGKPFPIFSSSDFCAPDLVWPKPGEVNLDLFLENHSLTYHQACPCGYPANQIERCPVTSCPLPVIKKIFVPRGVELTFTTNKKRGSQWQGERNGYYNFPPDSPRAIDNIWVEEFGAWKISASDIPSNFNEIKFGKAESWRWKSSERNFDFKSKDTCRQWDDTDDRKNYSKLGRVQIGSSVNCDSKIFPSFAPVFVNMEEKPEYFDYDSAFQKKIDNGEASFTTQQWHTLQSDQTELAYCGPRREESSLAYGGRVYGYALIPGVKAFDEKDLRFNSVGVATASSYNIGCEGKFYRFKRKPVPYPVFPPVDPYRTIFGYGARLDRRVNATLDNIQISLEGRRSWKETQARACIDLDVIGFNGIDIFRYQKGSPTCDRIMEQFCIDSAFLANPQYQKACSCIQHQKRLLEKYGNLDIPVACFASQCANEDPAVYRTRRMRTGCSVQLCQQIIRIHGDQIKAQGNQTIECNGSSQQVVPTIDKKNSVQEDEQEPSKPITLKFGSLFYTSLISLGVIIFLLILFFIRRYRLKKFYQKKTGIMP